MSLKSALKTLIPPTVINWLMARRYHSGRKRFTAYDIEREFDGVRLKVHIADEIAKSWYEEGVQDTSDVKALQRRGQLKEGATVFDIGAHHGVIAMLFAKAVGASGRVVAVEAVPISAEIARRNASMNNLTQLTVLNAAGAAKPGHIQIAEGRGAVSHTKGNLGSTRVEALTIDSLTEKYGQPQVLLVDVEGFEVEVLTGAAETLKQHPDCLVETHVGLGLEEFGGSVEQVAAFFPPSAYDLFILEGEELIPFSPSAPQTKARFYLLALARNPSAGK